MYGLRGDNVGSLFLFVSLIGMSSVCFWSSMSPALPLWKSSLMLVSMWCRCQCKTAGDVTGNAAVHAADNVGGRIMPPKRNNAGNVG